MLEPDGRRTAREAVLYAFLLLPASLAPAVMGVAGLGYVVTALLLSVAMVALALRFAADRTDSTARALFYGSITYLPLVLLAMILSH